jgi:hypothetical protein
MVDRNALTEADRCYDSWQKNVITDCYWCRDAAVQGMASRCLAVNQEEIYPIFIFKDCSYARKRFFDKRVTLISIDSWSVHCQYICVSIHSMSNLTNKILSNTSLTTLWQQKTNLTPWQVSCCQQQHLRLLAYAGKGPCFTD